MEGFDALNKHPLAGKAYENSLGDKVEHLPLTKQDRRAHASEVRNVEDDPQTLERGTSAETQAEIEEVLARLKSRAPEGKNSPEG